MTPFEVDWWPKRVICGVGAVERLPDLLDELGRKRALVICGKSVAASETFQRIRQVLGGAFAGAFQGVKMHAPLPDLERGVALAKELKADVIVSAGGGSAIDSGKGLCLSHGVGGDIVRHALKPGSKSAGDQVQFPDLSLAHIAVPTTTGSGSEVTPTCGLFDPEIGHKRIFRHDKLIPDMAILDPKAAVGTPARLTACSGMTAVARCVEALYSGKRNPFRSALALSGLRMLIASLPATIGRPDDLDARSECLVASAMSAVAANVNVSTVHAVGHVVGGGYGLQHGVAHSILLAGGMKLMMPVLGEQQKQVLWAFGECPNGLSAEEAGRHAVSFMSDFVARLPIPQKLRDVGIERDDLASLAERASRDPILMSSGADLGSERILKLLEAAF